MSYRRKYFKGYCSNCGEIQRLTRVGENDDEGFLWLKCNNCSGLHDYPVERVMKKGRVLTEEEYAKREKAMADVRDYSPDKTYWRGQEIRHPNLDEVGKVVDKQKTEGDHKIIIVDFEKSGTKKLIEDAST